MSDFFVPDTTYIRDDPYKAPEIRPEFVCVGVATHPTKHDKRAFGFYRPGRFSPWRSDAMDSTGWARGWTVTAIDPLEVSWAKGVIHPDDPAEDTIVECTGPGGRPVALFLNAELREALGLALVDPDGEMDQPADAIVWRAELDGIPLGTYRDQADARAHCEDAELTDGAMPRWYLVDPDDEGSAWRLYVTEDEALDASTEYTVTPITVLAAHDPDGDA